MVNEEITELLKEIDWLESQQEGLELDDMDYISLQFEINMIKQYIDTLKELRGP